MERCELRHRTELVRGTKIIKSKINEPLLTTFEFHTRALQVYRIYIYSAFLSTGFLQCLSDSRLRYIHNSTLFQSVKNLFFKIYC